MADFDHALNKVIMLEGGYTDNPFDSGGKTMYGITEKEAMDAGFDGDMRQFPLSLATKIYREKYWDKVMGDDIRVQEIAEELFDTAVNCGVHTASKFLQRALNALRRMNSTYIYDSLEVDGNIGQKTMQALSAYLLSRDAPVLLKALNCLQGAYYIAISEKNSDKLVFVYGWLKNRIESSDDN